MVKHGGKSKNGCFNPTPASSDDGHVIVANLEAGNQALPVMWRVLIRLFYILEVSSRPPNYGLGGEALEPGAGLCISFCRRLDIIHHGMVAVAT